ncbi:MAG: Transformation system protein [uncultured Sulfurovum sp.]|uniref:Transformation system protein n=1 Tax=uncultured Sulfurovum sp. TaxID=269237 RepID=A0A6S6SKQ9_9BACT|nr:MAG: Transformation system protein [uncultured Sulfurovum sp.]
MNKVEELEQRWFKYKIKKVISPFLGFTALTVVAGTSYYFYDINKASLSPFVLTERATSVLGVSMDANKTMANPKEVKTTEISKVEVVEKPKVKTLEEVALRPVIPVIDMEKEERISNVKKVRPKQAVAGSSPLVRAKENNYLTPKELRAVTKAEQNVIPVPRKTKKMEFQTTSKDYLETLKAKFSKSKKPREALLLSKAYYKSANYEEAEKWALSANKLNSSSEESWLLFAKSKAKLGKRKEALKILVSYYKKSNSIKAKRLIGQIKAGRL